MEKLKKLDLSSGHIYVMNFKNEELIIDEASNDKEAVKIAEFALFSKGIKKGVLTDRLSRSGDPLIRIIKEWK